MFWCPSDFLDTPDAPAANASRKSWYLSPTLTTEHGVAGFQKSAYVVPRSGAVRQRQIQGDDVKDLLPASQ